VLELTGLGAAAAAGSPAVAQLLGGQMRAAAELTERLAAVCAGRSSRFKIPVLDGTGTPLGVDVRKVVDLGITPAVTTGILHRSDGTGQVGRGRGRSAAGLLRRRAGRPRPAPDRADTQARCYDHPGDVATAVCLVGRADQRLVLLRHACLFLEAVIPGRRGLTAPIIRRCTCRSRLTVGSTAPQGTPDGPLARNADGPGRDARGSDSTEGSHRHYCPAHQVFRQAHPARWGQLRRVATPGRVGPP